MTIVTFGADPEAFFTKEGSVLPARIVFDKIAGAGEIETKHGNLIVDGAALEFQPNPSTNPGVVVKNVRGLLAAGVDLAESYGTSIAIVPELPIDLDWCRNDPDLAVFGCSPDMSAWGDSCQPAAINAAEHPWRYAGCHLHFGPDPSFFDDLGVERVVKALDRTVGLASQALSGKAGNRRRGIYGRPGVFRNQPWGLEYRTPSNIILRSPRTLKRIFEIAGQVIRLVETGRYDDLCRAVPADVLRMILERGTHQDAHVLFRRVASEFGIKQYIKPPLSHWRIAWGV